MESRLVKDDPVRGVRTWVDIDADGAFTFRTETYDWRATAELAKRMASVNAKGGIAGHTQRHIQQAALLPLAVYMDLKERGIMDDPAAFKRWINDPDNRHFRTYEGRV